MIKHKEAGALPKPLLSFEEEERIIVKWFGCPLKYLRKRGTSITIDVIGMAYDGIELKPGLLEGRE